MPEWRGEESEGGRGEERQGRERKVGRTRGRVGDHSGGWRAREGEEGWRVGVGRLGKRAVLYFVEDNLEFDGRHRDQIAVGVRHRVLLQLARRLREGRELWWKKRHYIEIRR